MKTIFKYRNIVFIPLFLYVFSMKAAGELFFGVNPDVYLMLFCLLSLVVFGIEILAYFKWKNLDELVKGYAEIIFNFVFSYLMAGYSTYFVFKNGPVSFFIIIGLIYWAQGVFWAMVLLKRKKTSSSN